MTDKELENYTSSLLVQLGYKVTETANKHNLSFSLTSIEGKQIIVKVKSHKNSVGIRLVQKTLKEWQTIDASECWMITNGGYTKKALKFASSNNLKLYDRDQLIKWSLKAKRAKKEQDNNHRESKT
ncbi:restriction endonuclease [Bacillus sp. M6-12]|uniref:restriction endonuclease n=1 Tax=Bacillus sp. M6-12 TaxID=2054166 RepID=UPI0021553FFF|nr:restriction endonuclease [Bacillus sp. M6-12]